jgi:hypothetical protein
VIVERRDHVLITIAVAGSVLRFHLLGEVVVDERPFFRLRGSPSTP